MESSEYKSRNKNTVGLILIVSVCAIILTLRIGVSRAPGTGHLAVEGCGCSYTHTATSMLRCTMAQGLRQEGSTLLYRQSQK